MADMVYPSWFEDHPFRPAQCAIGDEKDALLFSEVGMLCTQWENMHYNISLLVFGIVGASGSNWNNDIAIIVQTLWGRISKSSQSIDSVFDLVEMVFQAESKILADYKLIRKHLGRISPLRNSIIHGAVSEFYSDRRSNGYFLREGLQKNTVMQDARVDRRQSPQKYTAKMVHEVRKVTNLINREIIELTQEIDSNSSGQLIENWWK